MLYKKIIYYIFILLPLWLTVLGNASYAQSELPNSTIPTKSIITKSNIDQINGQIGLIQDGVDSVVIPEKLASIEHTVTVENIAQKISTISVDNVTQADLDESVTASEEVKNILFNLNKQLTELKSNEQLIKENQSKIREIQQLLSNPLNKLDISADDTNEINRLLDQSKNLSKIIEDKQKSILTAIKLFDNKSQLIEIWKSTVSKAYTANSSKKITKAKETEQERLTEKYNQYLENSKNIQHKLESNQDYLKIEQVQDLRSLLYYNRNMAWISKLDIDLLNSFYSQGIRIVQNPDSLYNLPTADLQKNLDIINKNITTLEINQKEILKRKANFEIKKLNNNNKDGLAQAFNLREQSIADLLENLKPIPELIESIAEEKRKKALYTRDHLYQDNNFIQGTQEVSNSLVLIGYQIKISFNALYNYFKKHIWIPVVFTIILLISLIFTSYVTRNFVCEQSTGNPKKVFDLMIIQNIREFFFIFRYRYILIILLSGLIILVKLSDIPPPSNKIILLISYLLLFLILSSGLIRIILNREMINHNLARQARVSITLFFLFIALYLLSKYSSAPYLVTSIFEKVLFLNMIYFILTIRSVIVSLTKQANKGILNRTFIISIDIMVWLSILFTLIGLSGYNLLAWALMKYTSSFVFYILSFIYGINIINDFRKFSKLYCIKHFEHGAFIAQDIASPFSSILKILWLVTISKVFFVIFDWGRYNYLISKTNSIINYVIVKIGDTEITPLNTILSIILLSMIFKIGKWFKSVSYRWFFNRISDLGIRNSLSIFSQYFIICTGLIITLNIIGIDLTSLAVFAGAIGVGVGLGLQDIAKNFISGILLLIERPLRTGDTVDINNIEGNVKRIGMRAITLETFDHKEVIIPNSGVISKEFTNWTHTNTMLRTILFVGANYESKPDFVIKVIKDVLDKNPAILSDPCSNVIMWEFADSAINYRLHFYIDLNISSLLATRNDVLSEIWDRFKENGISFPFPQRDIHIKK